jgi:hypothetical protein
LERPGDARYLVNQSLNPASLIYKVEHLGFASVRILHAGPWESAIRLYASADGQEWHPVTASYRPGPELEGGGWRYGILVADASGIPPESAFFKVELLPESAAKVRLDKVVAESASVPSDPDRSFYRFAEMDDLLLNGRPVDGFDPEVTDYISRTDGANAPVLGLLLADPRLETRIDPVPSKEGGLQITVGFPGEKGRVYRVKWTDG